MTRTSRAVRASILLRRGSTAMLVAAGLVAAGPALAMQLRQLSANKVVVRDGVVQPAPPEDKIHSPGLPASNAGSFTLSATVLEGTPGGGASSVSQTSTYDVVADPGDSPSAKLCVTYHYASSISGTVTVAPGSAAAGIGGTQGFTVSSGPPASATFTNPVTLVVTPAVGPDITILSVAPFSVTTTSTTQSHADKKAGRFFAGAGDTIKLDMALGGAARAELTDGAAQAQGTQDFRLAGCDTRPVPAPSMPVASLAALLLLVAAFAFGAVRIGRRRGR